MKKKMTMKKKKKKKKVEPGEMRAAKAIHNNYQRNLPLIVCD